MIIRHQNSVRSSHWKLVVRGQHDNSELYNLSHDIGEVNDVANKYPEIVQQLTSELETWKEDVYKTK